LRPGHDGSDEDAPSQRLSWYRCACCPPNLGRLLASLNGYLATTDASGLQVHLYSAATISASVPGGQATLQLRTEYPWDGRIELTVDSTDSDQPWTLALRVPAWCAATRAWVDGAPIDVEVVDGYLRVHRAWAAGASVVLDLDMPARLIAAHPRVDAVRGCVALARGPIVYCLEQADLDGVDLDDVRLDPSVAPRIVKRDDVLDVPIVITAQGTVPGRGRTELYSDWDLRAADASTPVELTAIPYYRWANREPGPMRVWVPATENAQVTGSPSS
jgi:uncharacterized protein